MFKSSIDNVMEQKERALDNLARANSEIQTLRQRLRRAEFELDAMRGALAGTQARADHAEMELARYLGPQQIGALYQG